MLKFLFKLISVFISFMLAIIVFGIVSGLFDSFISNVYFDTFVTLMVFPIWWIFYQKIDNRLQRRLLPDPLQEVQARDEATENTQNVPEKVIQDTQTRNDISELISVFDEGEKIALLLGLLALYGDGEFSLQEIEALKKWIKDSDFQPYFIIHRDESDKDLCLDEKVVWVLNFIRDNFIGTKKMSKEEIKSVFTLIAESLFSMKRTHRGFWDEVEWRNGIGLALRCVAKADGKITSYENELLGIVAIVRLSRLINPMNLFR